MEENKTLTRTTSVLFNKQTTEEAGTTDEKRLKRWDSLRVVARSVSGLSEIGKSMVGSVRSKNKGSTKVGKSKTLRGFLGGKGKEPQKSTESHHHNGPIAPAPRNDATQVFGVSLVELMERQSMMGASNEIIRSMHIPVLVNKLIEHLMLRGTKTEGILRLAGAHNDTEGIKQKFNAGANVDLYVVNVHVIGDVLKSFIREIPGSLLDNKMWDKWMQAADIEPVASRAAMVKQLVLDLHYTNRAMLTVLFSLLREVTRNQKYTRMDCVNVAKVFAPNVLQQSADKFDALAQLTSIPKVTIIVETMISQYDVIFRELKAQYVLVRTINLKTAVAARGQSSTKTTLRNVPAPPPPVAVPAPLPQKTEIAATASTDAPELKRMKSEDVLNQRFRLEVPQKLVRSQTIATLPDKEVEGKTSKRMRNSDAENNVPNTPPKKHADKTRRANTHANGAKIL